MGGFEPEAKPWLASDGSPAVRVPAAARGLGPVRVLMRGAIHRVPVMEKTGVKKFYNGPESFTPDHNFIMGQAPQLANYFVGGRLQLLGYRVRRRRRARRRWIVAGEPTWISARWTSAGSPRSRATSGGCAAGSRRSSACTSRWPGRTASPRAPGGCAAPRAPPARPGGPGSAPSKAGSGPTGSRRPACAGTEYGWGRQNWFCPIAAEHRAARENVALFDQTSFAKIAVRGRDAEAALQWLCAGDVAVPDGRTVYTGCSTTAAGTRPTSP